MNAIEEARAAISGNDPINHPLDCVKSMFITAIFSGLRKINSHFATVLGSAVVSAM